MNFTFLHCADLHLGSPLIGLSSRDPDVARRLAAASREAFSELVRKAIEEKVAFVLIAGDLYDGEWRDATIGLFFNREVSRLAREKIPVFVVKGNHDAASVVTSSVPLPESVTVFSTRKFETHCIEDLRVAVHGRSFPERHVTDKWAVEYPRLKEGWFNIGLLHTSCDGRPPHEPYAPCSISDMAARGYDYWALGHVHEYEILSRDPWIVYPGNLQGRHIGERGAKGAVLVDVVDGRIKDVRRSIVDRGRFALVEIDASGMAQEDDIWKAIEQAVAPHRGTQFLVAIRVRLTGATILHADLIARRTYFVENTQSRLHHEDSEFWLESLVIATSEPAHANAPGLNPGGLDLAAMLAGLETDEKLRTAAVQEIALLKAKLPPGARDELEAEPLDKLIAEARALVLGRISGAAG